LVRETRDPKAGACSITSMPTVGVRARIGGYRIGRSRKEPIKLNDGMRKSLVRLLAHAYAMGARRMIGLVAERFREYTMAHALGQDIDIKAKLMVDALILEQEALQFGERMVARLEEQRGEGEPPLDTAD
jgi:hypothetical protein